MVIEETKQTLEQVKQSLEQQRQQTEIFQPKIQLTKEQLLRQTPASAVQVRQLEGERTRIQQETLQKIKDYEVRLSEQAQSFEEYMRTPEGVREYAREFNVRPTEEYVNVVVDNKDTLVTVKTYRTPYGTYVDDSEVRKAQALNKFYMDVKSSPKDSLALARLQARYGITELQAGKALEYAQSSAEFQKQIENLKSQGLNPITETKGGITTITGFEDTKIGMSYRVEDLPKVVQEYRVEDIPQLERAGIIKTVQTTSFPTPEQELYDKATQQINILTSKPFETTTMQTSLPYQTRGTSFYSQQQGYYPPKSNILIPKQQTTLGRFKEITTEIQVRDKLKYQKLKESGSPWAFFYSTGEESGPTLPYGLEPKQEYISGEKFSPFYFHMYAGRAIAERLPLSKDINVPQWLQTTTKIAKPIVAEIPKVYFFAPFMKTGAAKKGTKQTTKQVSKKTTEKVAKKLEKVIKEAKSREEAQKGIIEFTKQYKEAALKSGIDKSTIDANLREILRFSQERGFFTLSDISKSSMFYDKTAAETFTLDIDISAFSTNLPPTLQRIPEMQLGAKTFLEMKPEFKAFESQTNFLQETKPSGKIVFGTLSTVGTIPIISSKVSAKSQQQPKIKLKPQLQPKQEIQENQLAGLEQIQFSMLSEKTKTQQVQRIQQIQRQPTMQKAKLKTTQKTKIPFVVFPKPVDSKLKSAAKKISSMDGFDVFIRRYGKDIKKTTKKTLKQAERYLGKGLKSSLAASGFIVAKKTGRKIPITELDLGMEFRPAKRDITRVVQKRGFRLGTFGEVKEIQKSRKKKQKDTFFDFIGGRKSKKRLKNLGWFK